MLSSNTTYLRVECVEQHDQLLVDVLDGGDDDVRHIPRIVSNGALPCVPQSGDKARFKRIIEVYTVILDVLSGLGPLLGISRVQFSLPYLRSLWRGTP